MHFFNISNHPSGKWTEKQMVAARTYKVDDVEREIVDILHPVLDPLSSGKEVYNIAQELLCDIDANYGIEDGDVFLVQGEYVFCMAIVSMLQAQTAKTVYCVSATTERRVSELPDGSCRRWFEFCQYREYVMAEHLPY